ncbi:hypothetical protein ACFLWE_00600 [Chloroflexota bacterium]
MTKVDKPVKGLNPNLLPHHGVSEEGDSYSTLNEMLPITQENFAILKNKGIPQGL